MLFGELRDNQTEADEDQIEMAMEVADIIGSLFDIETTKSVAYMLLDAESECFIAHVVGRHHLLTSATGRTSETCVLAAPPYYAMVSSRSCTCRVIVADCYRPICRLLMYEPAKPR